MMLARFNRITMVLVGVLLVAGASADVVYENDTYTLTRDSIVEGDLTQIDIEFIRKGIIFTQNLNVFSNFVSQSFSIDF